jgi:hypothetical protein
MRALKIHPLATLTLLLSLGAVGCLEDKGLRTNKVPEANAGEDQIIEDFPDDADTVTVELDGSKSVDDDGEIVEYRWLNVQAVDAGAMYGRGDVDPDDVEKPEVELARGTYQFTLWVVDDSGNVSKPDRVTITVGSDPVQACVDSTDPAVVAGVGDACVACACAVQDDTTDCTTAVPTCDEMCWALVACIAANCTNPDTDLTTCAIENCPDSLGGAMGAQAVGPCLTSCPADCGGG